MRERLRKANGPSLSLTTISALNVLLGLRGDIRPEHFIAAGLPFIPLDPETRAFVRRLTLDGFARLFDKDTEGAATAAEMREDPPRQRLTGSPRSTRR
jgi:hypothetical protein